jgi:hypothetical protein
VLVVVVNGVAHLGTAPLTAAQADAVAEEAAVPAVDLDLDLDELDDIAA